MGDLVELIFVGIGHAIMSVVGDGSEKSRWKKAIKITGILIVAAPFVALGLYLLVAEGV